MGPRRRRKRKGRSSRSPDQGLTQRTEDCPRSWERSRCVISGKLGPRVQRPLLQRSLAARTPTSPISRSSSTFLLQLFISPRKWIRRRVMTEYLKNCHGGVDDFLRSEIFGSPRISPLGYRFRASTSIILDPVVFHGCRILP